LKNYLIALAAGISIWISAAWYLEHKKESVENAYRERDAVTQRYESLGKLWSKPAQKSGLSRFDTILRLYRIRAQKSRVNNRQIYRFEVAAENADTVLSKILALPLAIESFEVRRKDDHALDVRVGVAP
jgi:hypothetical protein